MRNAILTGATALVAAAALAAPAMAATAPAPQIVQSGTCTVRHSKETKAGFTYANCLISVNNVPSGQTIKVNYKSNLKTYSPKGAEFGPFDKQSGTLAFRGGEVRGLELAFPGKTAAQVKKQLKITLTSPTAGVAPAVATA